MRKQATVTIRTPEVDPIAAVCLDQPMSDRDQESEPGAGTDAEARLDRGDLDGAVVSMREAWQLAQDDPQASGTVAACLRVLVRIGNAERAVDLLVPRLGWLAGLETPSDRMWFAATAAFVLEQAAAAGVAPEAVGGRPVDEVAGELSRTADEIAATLDEEHGSTVTSSALAAAHDPAQVSPEPALPPTRLPSTPPEGAVGRAVPATTAVLDRAQAVSDGLARAGADLEPQMEAWLRDRDGLLPVTTPEEWAAVALLDRTVAQDAGPPGLQRALLTASMDAAHRADDAASATRSEGEVALLDVVEAEDQEAAEAASARARACAERLESGGADEEAGALWRRFAWFGGSDDPAGHLARAAAAYGRAGLTERSLLCDIEQAMATAPVDQEAAAAMLESLEPDVAGIPVLASIALDGRARIARSTGDLDVAAHLLERARSVRGVPRRARLAELVDLCDVRVEQEAWAELESPAADLVAAATRDRDPVLLALGQRLLGLAYVETGRPAEAAELLDAALPVLREYQPGLVGPAGWALGNALLALGLWAGASTAFATASAAFEDQDRLREAAHTRWCAGNAAWDAGDVAAAAGHFDDAVDQAHRSGTVGLYVEAMRSRAALTADTTDLSAGLADLDAAIPAGAALAAEIGVGEDDFDGEVLEPHVLRQGAHLLAQHGEVDAAVERLARAEALVGHDFELVLRTEAGIFLADDDQLEVAEPRLRRSITELHAAGLVPTRIDAAGALARALDRAGRSDEAEEVWEQYGPGE